MGKKSLAIALTFTGSFTASTANNCNSFQTCSDCLNNGEADLDCGW